ncbi:uncharacterized protein LOC101457945 [Ceratitis capitata]|uniref:(Mediterranean fruit fly) hypothetical protein n=1 Tax=Ceratitis capitata TaxID=7213 RepID=W8C412_CERCA|nr:uncharacterized protein LOC101457945 [Ceratitis capitata]CAD7005998.1 unnamed protein product [Ceratitis capitata]
MNFYKISVISVFVLLLTITTIDAKKHKKHRSSYNEARGKSKTKTKWSSSTDLSRTGAQLATEEHGYYVKRTFLPLNATANQPLTAPRSPPFLAVPIAWFACEGEACTKANTATIGGSAAALQDGFLCDDDCVEPYAPICGRTSSELAVFYNKCKLNVAKCRTHGLWLDVAYEECQKSHPKEVAYAERKFKSSPFFKNTKTVVAVRKPEKDSSSSEEDDSVFDVALQALDKIGDRIAEAEAAAIDEASTAIVLGEVNAPTAKPVKVATILNGTPIPQPVKEISTTAKPVKTSDGQKLLENDINKPVVVADNQPTTPPSVAIISEAGSNAAKVVVRD